MLQWCGQVLFCKAEEMFMRFFCEKNVAIIIVGFGTKKSSLLFMDLDGELDIVTCPNKRPHVAMVCSPVLLAWSKQFL
jgi:hypothetical protein